VKISNKNFKYIAGSACIMFGCALYAMHTDKMRVGVVCRDARLYMDGGIDATIEAGGLNYHHAVKVFRLSNRDDLFIGGEDVVEKVASNKTDDVYQSKNVQLTIFKSRGAGPHGMPARLQAVIASERIDVAMNCNNKH